MQMQGYVASSDPEVQAHVRRVRRVVAEVTRLSGAAPEDVWTLLRPRACFSTSRPRWTSPPIADDDEWAGGVVAGRADHRLPPDRTLMLDRSPASSTAAAARCSSRRPSSCSPPARSAARSSACSTRDDDFEDPPSEAVQARETIERATGRSAAPDAIVLVRLGAQAGTPRGPGQARAWSRRCATATSPRCRRSAAPGRRAADLARTGARPTSPVTFYAGADEEEAADALERAAGAASRA